MIYFHFETEPFEFSEESVREWLNNLSMTHEKENGEINYIFCDDAYLLEMNIKYLNHNTLTDIISFDNSMGNLLEGDIFISVERVEENAKEFGVDFRNELHRVMAHGLLHFAGFKDKTESEKEAMRKAEDEALALRI
ncbi:MAG: rRNA maturation RNase YbeY [Flavobacteriaceae bacterium]|nr:rRNA maturation RNase YbeY [Flavobacteriaceae bacterium]|tara:strand:- start:333823 stop:334233 length:411 start_codon:yes stop_codon:yes gene_type:complete